MTLNAPLDSVGKSSPNPHQNLEKSQFQDINWNKALLNIEDQSLHLYKVLWKDMPVSW